MTTFYALKRKTTGTMEPTLYKRSEAARAKADQNGLYDVVPLYDTTPARAEAQDEGAAALRESVAKRVFVTVPNIKGAWETAYQIADAVIPLFRRTHPSPPPAADEDRVRIAVEALEEAKTLANRPDWKQQAYAVKYRIGKALAALKSEGK